MQAYQREQGMPVTPDEEVEKAVQKLVEAKFGTQSGIVGSETN